LIFVVILSSELICPHQLMINTEKIIRHALQEGVKITLVVNKLDRLILELRIKPADAYYKIKHTIEEINTFMRHVPQLAPIFFIDHLLQLHRP